MDALPYSYLEIPPLVKLMPMLTMVTVVTLMGVIMTLMGVMMTSIFPIHFQIEIWGMQHHKLTVIMMMMREDNNKNNNTSLTITILHTQKPIKYFRIFQ